VYLCRVASVERIALLREAWAPKVELILQTGWGAYAATTLWGCATRKYHSYLSLWIDGQRYEILPQIEEELRSEEGLFRLTTQYWRDQLAWAGYRYLEGFRGLHPWIWTYRFGRLNVQKRFFLAEDPPLWLLEYSFTGEGFPVLFRWAPLWAVRPWHTLRFSYEHPPVKHEGPRLLFPELGITLYLAFSPAPRAIPWNYLYEAISYPEEAQRGYPHQENLHTTELFEWNLYQPTNLRIQISPLESPPTFQIPSSFSPAGSTLKDILHAQAENFFLESGGKTYILAGHPWFGIWGRDTFISLPGLTLAREREDLFHRVCESYLSHLSADGRFPNTIPGEPTSEDVGLWWLWALMQYSRLRRDSQTLWERYGEAIQAVLVSYLHRIAGEDGLLRVGAMPPPSWMDAVVDGNPGVYRAGALVELNALWYAALRWVGEAAPQEGIRWRWNLLAHRVINHFKPTFWQKAKGYLADWMDLPSVSWQIRPNQLWAAAVPFRPISDKIAELVVDTIETHLLTPRGLRTLSPMDPQYLGTYQGDQPTRDRAYHNGSVWPFLLGAYADALLGLYGDAAAPKIRKLYESFAEALWQYGWGYLAEIYEGDAPHLPRGAPAQAWSIAELLRIAYLLRL